MVCFLTKRLRELLPESRISSDYLVGAYATFPGILTGLGLTLTFGAIVLALPGVHYNKNTPADPVSAIDGLINGVSGKFVSFICGACPQRGLEKRTLRRFGGATTTQSKRGRTCSRTFPKLISFSTSSDLPTSRSFRSATLAAVDRLVDAFQTQVSPALADGVSSGMAGRL